METNNDTKNTNMTTAERAEMQAKVAALRLEAKKLAASLRADEATDEVAKTSGNEKKENPIKVIVVNEQKTTTDQKEISNEESAEPIKEEDATNQVANNSDDGNADSKGEKIWKWITRGLVVVTCVAMIIATLFLAKGCADAMNSFIATQAGQSDTTEPGTTEQPGDTTEPGTTEQPNDTTEPGTDIEQPTATFELSEFKKGVENLIDYYGGSTANKSDLILLIEKIGEDKLAELCTTYGTTEVQENVAHFLVYGADAQMNVYIADNNLQYNPNYTKDYFDEIDRITAVYKEATGKDASSVLKNLEGYDVVQGNVDATIALIGSDTQLLTWYTAKCVADEKLYDEIEGTNEAEAYRDNTVKLEIVSSNGTVKLLEEQLKDDSFELGKASEAYTQFMKNNYKFVVVGNN